MIELRGVTHTYTHGSRTVTALTDVNLTVPTGTITAVVGPSGSGKSTLARCVSLLSRPSQGSVLVDSVDLASLPPHRLRAERRAIGTVFQSHALLRRKTALRNVTLPLECTGIARAERTRIAEDLLGKVGLADKITAYPHQLSGGQQQRVGIARALSLRPRILVADEPTSGLDNSSTRSLLQLLRSLREELGLTILIITHEMNVVRTLADSVAVLDRGRITDHGSITSFLSDPESPLGDSLVHHFPDAHKDTAIRASYVGERVPQDWIGRIGRKIGADIRVLEGHVETIQGQTVGRYCLSSDAPRATLVAALAELGIEAR